MPKLGMTMEEGTVVRWLAAKGAAVARGEVVLLIESEKNEVEIEASASGVLRHIYVDDGDTVACGSLLGAITASADDAFDAEAFHKAEHRPETKGGGALTVKRAAPKAQAQALPTSTPTRRAIAPAARAAARRLGIALEQIPGSGPGGRVTKQDVETFAVAREALLPVADDVRLEVFREGEGEAVLLLPGFGVDVSAFARQTSVLVENFKVCGVNPRGVGLSDAPEADAYEVAQCAADIAALCDTLGGAAHLVGASLGAAVALELAIAQPERVKSLTLITPFAESNARLDALLEAWQRLAAEVAPDALAGALLPWFFSTHFLADEDMRARTRRGLAKTLSRTPAASLERFAAGLGAWSGSRAQQLGEVKAPTLVVVAGEDLMTPDAELVAAAIPNARRLLVPGAGHAVALEAGDAVNEALLAHLAAQA